MNAAGEKWPPATGKGLRAGTQAGGLDARGGTYDPLALVSFSTDGCEGDRRGHHGRTPPACAAQPPALADQGLRCFPTVRRSPRSLTPYHLPGPNMLRTADSL